MQTIPIVSVAILRALVLILAQSANAADSLQLTAIVGKDMRSTLECWTFNQAYSNGPFVRDKACHTLVLSKLPS